MKSKITMILFVLILGSSLTTALVAVDKFTKEPIARNKAKKLQKGILSSLNIEYGEDDQSEIFSANVETIEIVITEGADPKKFYRSKTSGDIAFEISGTGVQGQIDATIALSPDLERIRGLSIVAQTETPGLGSRIAEAEFLDRFKDKNITSGLSILAPGKAAADNEVDGISGATLSCNAFEDILNNEIKRYVPMIEENK
jgi:Na+-transporting NADH:ubiquinone oxidoreductase subunit C